MAGRSRRPLLFTTLFLLLGASAAVAWDPGFTAANEGYLAPWLDQLAIYRDSAIGRALINLANLADILPSWLEDLLIPLLLPGATASLPLHLKIPIKLPLGPVRIPLPAHVELESLTLNDLDQFKTLRPAKLLNGNFTWGGDLALERTTVTLNGSIVVLGKQARLTASVPLASPSLHFETIAAFNRTKLCEVWGAVMRSTASCALWPIVMLDSGVSGLNVTSLVLNMTDFDFNLTVSGLGPLDDVLQKQLTSLVSKHKQEILDLIPTLDAQLASWATAGIVKALPKLQAKCNPAVLRPSVSQPVLGAPLQVLNVSRVCLSNNAAFVLKWQHVNCPALLESDESPGFPVDQSRCMEVSQSIPATKENDPIRVRSHAVAGLHHLLDPPLRYVANSNAATFECSGTTLDYGCTLVSVSPVDPNVLPRAGKICIINHAGFVMEFAAENTRTGVQAGTGRYPIDQTQCVEPGSIAGTVEGDQFNLHVHAILGKRQDASRAVVYANNSLTATFECTGTTLNYHCDLLGAPAQAQK